MISSLLTSFAVGARCNLDGGNLFGFPHWYKYLDGAKDSQNLCAPIIGGINDVWLILAAGIEILLRLSALAAVVFIIYGCVIYIISQGEPDKTAQAKSTIVNAMVGLALSVMAAAVVTFVAGSIT